MIFSQNRLFNLREDAEDYSDILAFYNNHAIDENAMRIVDVLAEANMLLEATDNWEALLELTEDEQRAADTNRMAEDKKKQQEEKKAEEKKDEGGKKSINKDSFFEKISNLLHKFVEAIKKVFGNVVGKISDVASNDNKIVAKYKPYLEKWDSYKEGFEGLDIAKENAEKLLANEDFSSNFTGDEFLGIAQQYVDKINNAKSTADIETLEKEAQEKLNETLGNAEKLQDDARAAGKKAASDQEKYVPAQEQVTYALAYMETGLSSAMKMIEATKDKYLNELKQLEIKAKHDFKDARDKDNESLDTARTKACFKLYQIAAKKVGSAFSAMMNSFVNLYRISRKIVVGCGKYAAEKKNGSKQAEEEKTEKTEKTEASQETFVMANEGSDVLNSMLEGSEDEFIAFCNEQSRRFAESSDQFIYAVFAEDTKEDMDKKMAELRKIKEEKAKLKKDEQKVEKDEKKSEPAKEDDKSSDKGDDVADESFSWFD